MGRYSECDSFIERTLQYISMTRNNLPMYSFNFLLYPGYLDAKKKQVLIVAGTLALKIGIYSKIVAISLALEITNPENSPKL